MLLGIWKSVAELESLISLDELEAILKASHEKEHRRNKFTASLKGIDLDEGEGGDARSKFEAVKSRVDAMANGASKEEAEFAAFGLDVEIE